MPKGNKIGKKQVVAPAITAALVLIVAPAILSTGAFAQNPHFVGTPNCEKGDLSGPTVSIECSGKVAGLGSETANVFITASSVDVSTECDNPGKGANPPGQDESFGAQTGDSEPITPRNGQITFRNIDLSVTVDADQAGCPGKMEAVITSAIFHDVVVHVEQGGEEITSEPQEVDP